MENEEFPMSQVQEQPTLKADCSFVSGSSFVIVHCQLSIGPQLPTASI